MSWNPQGLFRTVMGFPYFYIHHRDKIKTRKTLSRTVWPAGLILNVWYMDTDHPTVNYGGIFVTSSLCYKYFPLKYSLG
jgi:hypothetical protein